MPVIHGKEIVYKEIKVDGMKDVVGASVISPEEGWKNHTLRVFRIKPDGFSPHHQHDWEHINYVIKGEGTLTIGNKTHEFKAGDFAFVPANTVHQFKNTSDGDFEFICIVPNRGAY